MIAAICAGVRRYVRTPRTLLFLPTVLILTGLAGCGGSSKPIVTAITFTTDASGATPLCTTAMTSSTAASIPLCNEAILPSLTVGGPAVYMFADVANDNQVLGVSWSATCGSSTSVGSGAINTACGTFSPAHTMSGPVPLYPVSGIVSTLNPPAAIPKGATVTITAHATSLPSVGSSVTLKVVAAPSSAGASLPQNGHSQIQFETFSGNTAAGQFTGSTRTTGR